VAESTLALAESGDVDLPGPFRYDRSFNFLFSSYSPLPGGRYTRGL
jgi:hypothetical protein